MASGVYGLLQDQNSAAHILGAPLKGKVDRSKVVKQGDTCGRKPLSDLSNSVKFSFPMASKKLNSDISSTREDPSVSQITAGPRKKKGILSNRSEKNVSAGGRKALSDISNSGKLHLLETSKKTLKAPKRVDTVSKKQALPDTVSEECFLHNHGECLKAQMKSMDLDEILKVVGLDDGFIDQPASPWKSRAFNKLNANTSFRAMDIEEMTEQLLIEEEKGEPLSSLKLQTSARFKTARLSDYMFDSKNYDSVNFSLMETPKKL